MRCSLQGHTALGPGRLLGVGHGHTQPSLAAEAVGAMISVSFVPRCAWYNVSLSVCRSWFPSHLCNSSSRRYSHT